MKVNRLNRDLLCLCILCTSGVHFNSQAIVPTIEQIDQSFGATHPGGSSQSMNPPDTFAYTNKTKFWSGFNLLLMKYCFLHPFQQFTMLQSSCSISTFEDCPSPFSWTHGTKPRNTRLECLNRFTCQPVKEELSGCFSLPRGVRPQPADLCN